MIRATELRLGNLVIYNRKTENIHGVNYHNEIKLNLYADTYTEEDLQPIALTPEILEKCGFDKDGRKGLLHLQCTDMDPNYDYWVVGQYDKVDGQGHLLQDLRIKYLHQLQNLYFALTGEELPCEL